MSSVTIYHNPRCSKSRQTLALLQERGIKPDIVLYLEQVPDPDQLASLCRQLGLSPRQLLRTGEAEYRQLDLDDPALDDKAILQAMAEHPRLIERPIVVKGNKAVLGRPPENVLELI